MAATFTPTRVDAYIAGNKRVKVFDIAVSGTYTTGGDTFNASLLGLHRLTEFRVHGGATDGTLQYPVQPIYAANQGSVLVKLFETGTGGAGSAEKGSGESLTSVTFRVTAVGV